MRKIVIKVVVAVVLIIIPLSNAVAQDDSTNPRILTLMGDYNKPYEVVDGFMWTQEVKDNILKGFKGEYESAIAEIDKQIQALVPTIGGDAVIDMQFKYIHYNNTRPVEIGLVAAYGTVIRFVDDTPASEDETPLK